MTTDGQERELPEALVELRRELVLLQTPADETPSEEVDGLAQRLNALSTPSTVDRQGVWDQISEQLSTDDGPGPIEGGR